MNDDKCYSAWRRSEAYSVPMTKEGVERADERYKQFKVGWDYAVKACMFELEKEHSKHKKAHTFYNIAKDIISSLRVFK